MMIRIRNMDDCFDMVKASRLEYLIQARQISCFKRSSGWIIIDRDPIRDQSNRERYRGSERREPAMAKSLLTRN